jgi:hypothetical protein
MAHERLPPSRASLVAGLPFSPALSTTADACALSEGGLDGERKDYLRLANSCVKCHADVVAEHQGSAHASSPGPTRSFRRR